MKKALVLYSGGLDSRLVVRILQEQNYKIKALYFALPFGCSCPNCEKIDNLKLTIVDVTKEPLLLEYLSILKKPKFGRGAGINPCIDCKIFIFKKAKEYADKHKYDIIATGEVPGQRPMSQTSSAQKKIDEEINFEITRPLADAGFSGRSRKKQMALAEKYKIKYPSPGGGCFLCEKEPVNRLKTLLKNDLITEKTLQLTMIGRHFYADNIWFVVARDEAEGIILDKFDTILEGSPGKPTVYFSNKKGKQKALELQEAYSTGDNDDKREKFEKVKL